MIDFVAESLRLEPGPRPSGISELQARFVAHFRIVVGGRVLFEEDGFPVLEFAVATLAWLRDEAVDGRDFEFDSMSYPEPGLVWIRRSGSGWRVGSVLQEYAELHEWSLEQLQEVLTSFVGSVLAHVPKCLRELVPPDLQAAVPRQQSTDNGQ